MEFIYNSFEIEYSKLQSMNINNKIYLASLVVNKWIEYYLDNHTDNILIEQCKYFISLMTDEDKISLIINNTNNDINKLINILKLFDKSFIKLNKNNLFFNNIECLDYITNNFGYYDKNGIHNFLYDMAVNYYYVNINVVDWIINNYDNFIKNNIVNIIINIMNASNIANINNSYLIIEKILNIDNINRLSIFNIFKKSIYYNNIFCFELFLHNYYDYINIINMFELVCIYTNSNIPIETTLVPYMYINNNSIHNYNFSNLYNKLKDNKINNVVKWFDTYFDENFKLLLNEIKYMLLDINIKKEHCEETCMICYENNNNMISLGCCSCHITCSSCLDKWINNNNTCPMCRQNIIFNKCILYVI